MMEPGRLLMTADAVGGIWTYALDLGRGLRQRGVTVTIAVLGPGLDGEKRRAAAEADCAVVDLGHPPEWLAEGPDAVARAGAALADLAASSGADVVHLNHPALGADISSGPPFVAVCHSCVATWWSAMRGTSLPPDFAWRTALVERGLRAARAVVAPSQAFARATRGAYGLSALPLVVLNGRAAPATETAPRDPIAAGLTVGRLWDEGKGTLTLDRAAALAATPIDAIGPLSGPHGGMVAPAHLRTVGPMPDAAVRDALAARPVFLSAAVYEPFGLAVLEAAQSGCALVLADTATFRELWADAALFVRSGDAAGFARALDDLVADSHKRSRLADAARARAAAYSLDRQVEGMMAIYAELLPTAPAGSGTRAAEARTGTATV